jgi:transposase-like protein
MDGIGQPQPGGPVFDVALYSVAEAARLARVPRQTLLNWTRGYRHRSHGGIAEAPPIIVPTAPEDERVSLSFANLIEAVVLAGFREAGISMQKLRRALEYASRTLELSHLLASERLLTDGIDLFWEYQDQRSDEELHLVNVSRGGQKVFPQTVMQYLQRWSGARTASSAAGGPVRTAPAKGSW